MINTYSTQYLDSSDIKAVMDAIENPLLTQGPLAEQFELELAAFCNVKYALTFNSATSALYAAYRALNLENSSAITTPISFVATSNMLLQVKCKPIFCDVKKDGNIDENLIAKLITKNTRAIVSVDYAGKSVECDTIKNLAKEHGLLWISDSSHAIGSQYKGQNVGNLADATVFSFHPVKPITTLEGGALLSNNQEIYECAKRIRSHGVKKMGMWHYDVLENGFNFRMTEIQAALGISQLKKLSMFIEHREEIARFYDQFFHSNSYFDTLHPLHTDRSTNHLYPILLKPHLWDKKLMLMEKLHAQGIGIQIHYRPIYQFSYYQNLGYKDSLPNAESFYHSTLSIPCHHKMSLKTAKQCAETILKTFEEF